jgi:integrase
MSNRRDHGDGGIDLRQEHADGSATWRLRYYLNGKRHTTTTRGTKAHAKRELRRLIRSGEVGQHITPSKSTLAAWVQTWVELRRPHLARRTITRYADLLRLYALPTVGTRPLQSITTTDIDRLYVELRGRIADRTIKHVAVTMKGCLAAAVRKGLISINPCDAAETVTFKPHIGTVLDAERLAELLRGFRGQTIFGIVAVAAFGGLRLSEILALEWGDLDLAARTLTVERTVDTGLAGRKTKEPKSARGKRTIRIDDGLAAILADERAKATELYGELGDDTLVFPSPDADPRHLRNPSAVWAHFKRHARKLGFDITFHDLRRSHQTALLDAGVPIHVVAARGGHDPAMLLRVYAGRTRPADDAAANAMAAISGKVIGSNLGPKPLVRIVK